MTTNEQQNTVERSPDLGSRSLTTGFHFDEAEHAYFLDGKPLHGITSVLGVISKPALIQWAANMAVDFIQASYPYALLEDETLDQEVFANQLKEARVAHRKKKEDAAEKGTDLHAIVEEYIQTCIAENEGRPLSVVSAESPIHKFVAWAQENKIRFLASEQRLYSKVHWVAGTCDIVFEKEGKTYVGDVKTYKKIWDRTPFFQCAAYGMMWEEMKHFVPGGDPVVAGYCVLRLGKDGTFEDKWSFDVEGDRAAFLNALGLYKALKAYKA